MALVIVTGGTDGGTNGTPVSQSGRANPITFYGLNSWVNAHIRSADNDGADDLTFTLPAGLEVSFDGGTTALSGSDIAAPEVGPYNVPIKMRQTTNAAEEAGTFSTSGTFTADNTRPVLTGAIAATPSTTQVTLDWADATDNVGVDHYVVEYGTSLSYGSTVSPNPTVSTCVVTGLTPGTTYYFRAKAVDASGNASGWATGTTTTIAWVSIFANTFDSDTIGGRPNGWVLEDGGSGAPDPWAVQAGGLNSTARALRTTYDQSHTVFAYHTFTSYAKVRATFRTKTGATIGSGKRHGTYYFHNGTNPSSPAPTNCAVVSLKDGYVQVYNNSTWTNLVATSANTEYAIVMDFNATTDTYTVTVNGTLYDNSGNGWKYTATTNVTGVNMFTASNGLLPAGEYAYLDEITVEYLA